ncbi:hypothetical protein LUZ60_004919 [Juncus effusus]|nr:hypothetical protein LUZ60_004919 [Juncus effusus]
MEIDEILHNKSRAVKIQSRIYVWGYNQSGQTARLDKDDLLHLRIPKQISPKLFKFSKSKKNLNWVDISCGREHTAAVASDGSLFTWGSNEFGQLGDGTEISSKTPKKVNFGQTEFVKSVSCGASCTAAITEFKNNDGSVESRLYVWGQNQGSNYPRLFRGAFAPNTVFRQVSCGSVHVVALSEEGLLQAWGYNEFGQLGRGFTCEGLQKPRVINAFARFLDEAPEPIRIRHVACGEFHTAAISENGEVYTWGLGIQGQLGHYSLQSLDKELIPRRVISLEGTNITQISCGGAHTAAITSKGSLYSWGADVARSDWLGSVPVLVLESGVEMVACGNCHTIVKLRNDGRVYGWGYNCYGQAANLKSTYSWFPSPIDWCVGEVRKLAAGGGHSAVLTDACSLRELCEFRLAESVNLNNALIIEDIASRIGAVSLARLCEKVREHLIEHGDCDCGENQHIDEM